MSDIAAVCLDPFFFLLKGVSFFNNFFLFFFSVAQR